MAGLEGRRLGGCVLLQQIAQGESGELYLADQPELGRQVAVKVSRLEIDPTSEPDAMRAGAQFTHEAQAIAGLHHPNILPIYGVGVEDGLPYLIMPFMRDGSLATLVAPGPTHRLDLPLPPAVVVSLIAQVAAALQTAHDHQPRIVHGNVKPANLLALLQTVNPGVAPDAPAGSAPAIYAQVQLLVADFGLALTASDPNLPRQAAAATPYTAPEQFEGPAVPESDQYALACVAFELLTGRRVFDGEPEALLQQHAFVSPLSARQFNVMLPPAVDPVLLRALAKAPGERFGRVDEFARALGVAFDPAAQMANPAAGWAGAISRPLGVSSVPAGQPGTLPPPMAPPPMAQPLTVPTPTGPIPGALYAPSATVASPPNAPGASPPPTTTTTRRTLIGAGIAGIVLLAVGGGGGVYWFSRNHPTNAANGTPTAPGATNHPNDLLGVYRPTTGTFFLRKTLSATSDVSSLTFGKPGLLPVMGDWNGTGVDTMGVFDPTFITFTLAETNVQGAAIAHQFQFGEPGDIPLAGDWTGGGRDGIGIFRPSTNQFILRNSLSAGPADFAMQLGAPHDLPVVGDWNGDGHDSIGVFHPATQTFYLCNTVCGCAPTVAYAVVYGQPGDTPFAGNWTHTGRSGLGVFVPGSSTMSLKYDATRAGPADLNIPFGTSGDIPIAGRWGLGA